MIQMTYRRQLAMAIGTIEAFRLAERLGIIGAIVRGWNPLSYQMSMEIEIPGSILWNGSFDELPSGARRVLANLMDERFGFTPESDLVHVFPDRGDEYDPETLEAIGIVVECGTAAMVHTHPEMPASTFFDACAALDCQVLVPLDK